MSSRRRGGSAKKKGLWWPSPAFESMLCMAMEEEEEEDVHSNRILEEEDDESKPWIVENGERCEAWTVTGTGGLLLQVHSWSVAPGRQRLGTVVLFHGIDANARFDFLRLRSLDFSSREDDNKSNGLTYSRSFVYALNEAGFDCVAADMQGHGLSDSAAQVRSYFERFEDLVDDAELVCRKALDKFGDRRLYFVSLSYGGLLSASLAARLEVWRKSAPQPPPVECAGIVLLAPALSVEKVKAQPTNTVLLPIAKALSVYAPTLAIGDKPASPVYKQIERAMDIEVSLPLDNPHRTGCYNGNLRARVAQETMDATDRLNEHVQAGDLSDLPALLVHSRRDGLCDPAGSVRYRDANKKSSSLLFTQDIPGCDGMWHCLTQEPGAEVIFDRVVTWLVDLVNSSHHDTIDHEPISRIA